MKKPKSESKGISRRSLLATLGVGAASLLSTRCVSGDAPADAPEETEFPKGFFRVALFGDKWTFVTPDNQPLYLRGLNHYGDGSFMPLNLTEKYYSLLRRQCAPR